MITVLMSTYNGEKFIREQIDSILNQKNVEVKLFIRDDGSTDNTVKILKEYTRKNDNIEWYEGDNLGCGKSFFQLVLDTSKSDYYAFADQDDVWDNDKLHIAISKIDDYIDYTPALYCSTARPVDEELQNLPQKRVIDIDVTLGVALTQAIAPGCSFVFNHLLLDKFKKMKIDNIDIHDWALFRVVTAVDGYVYFDKKSYFAYRQHGNNVIGYQSSFFKHWVGRFKRFSNKDYRHIRHKMAVILKDTYYPEMTEYNKIIINKFVNYNLSFKNRMTLFTSGDIRMIKISDNIIFKLLILICKV